VRLSRAYREAHALTPMDLSRLIGGHSHIISIFERDPVGFNAHFAVALGYTCLMDEALTAAQDLLWPDEVKRKWRRFLTETIVDEAPWPDPEGLVPAFIAKVCAPKQRPAKPPKPTRPQPAPRPSPSPPPPRHQARRRPG
jgi:hypothetical protein